MEAVKQDARAIRFIHNPGKEVVMCYLLSIPKAIQLLQDPLYDLKWEEEEINGSDPDNAQPKSATS